MAQQLTQAAEVLTTPKSVQVWKALMNWLTFFFQIFIHFAHFLSYVGLRHTLLSSSSSSPPSSYKSLPVVEVPFRESPSSVTTTTDVRVDEDVSDGVDGVVDRPLKRLTVVLDLDETLVCSYETSSLPDHVRSQATEAGLKWFDLECLSVDKESDGKPKVNHVTVFERPGLHEFLKQIGEFADLVLFTAGLEGYARPLVDRIDVENCFSRRLYRPSTVSTEYREHVKDLSCLSEDLCRIVIVDNNPFSFLLQPLNGIPCIPFAAGSPFDEQLLDVLLPLLKHLSLQKDVRPVLYERFHMPEWFQMHGIPATVIAAAKLFFSPIKVVLYSGLEQVQEGQ
ncbi:FCP1 homology domain [Dillenia turbinata]|uniref:FCP1 homology domain n=1 Tax=Dillenia turbinata TaxID=194707 RepID=A0AAN8VYE3_9MAGN